MERLTNKDDDICTFCNGIGWCRAECKQKEIQERLKLIENMIEQGKLVEVVRCEECNFFQEKEGMFPICLIREKIDRRPHGDEYCSLGERREINETNI
jgi:hypothetical protein